MSVSCLQLTPRSVMALLCCDCLVCGAVVEDIVVVQAVLAVVEVVVTIPVLCVMVDVAVT